MAPRPLSLAHIVSYRRKSLEMGVIEMNVPGFTAGNSLLRRPGQHRPSYDKNVQGSSAIQPASIFDAGPRCFPLCIKIPLGGDRYILDCSYGLHCAWPGHITRG